MADNSPADSPSANVDTVRAQASNETKERIKAILGCDDAKGRSALAEHLAYETDTDVEGAKKLLSLAPVGKSASDPTEPDQNGAQAYEANRLRASAQALPGGEPQKPAATIDRAAIYASRRQAKTGA